MIKVELTKNIFNQRGGGLFGLKPIQLVFAAVAVVVGGLTVLWLMQYNLSIDLIGWIVFVEMAIIIGLGVVRPGGVNLFSFLLSSLKLITMVLMYMKNPLNYELNPLSLQ